MLIWYVAVLQLLVPLVKLFVDIFASETSPGILGELAIALDWRLNNQHVLFDHVQKVVDVVGAAGVAV